MPAGLNGSFDVLTPYAPASQPKPKKERKPKAPDKPRAPRGPTALPTGPALADALAAGSSAAAKPRARYMSQAHRDAIGAAVRRKWQEKEYRAKVWDSPSGGN